MVFTVRYFYVIMVIYKSKGVNEMFLTTYSTDLFSKSIDKATDIFMESSNLSDVGVSGEIYAERVPYLRNLLGDEGYVSFHPTVEKDLVEEFQNALEPELKTKHDRYYHGKFSSWDGDDGEKVARDEYAITDKLYCYISNNDLLNNRIPERVEKVFSVYGIKGFSSPKLSKLLVKLYGQDSDVVKWFTNKCPKKLDKGLNEDYRVVLSILPHHIAGMSYYAPFNWGGERWETGWNSTSCMDTIRNSGGEGIYQLPPSLRDSTLALAYLTKTDESDVFEPRFQARILVRVAQINDKDYVMVGLRPFYTSNETKNILIEGLRNEFENFVQAEHLRDFYNFNNSKTYNTIVDATWRMAVDRECRDCDGDGYDSDLYDCDTCDGTGRHQDEHTFFPYVDDGDIVGIYSDRVSITLPTDYLIKMGYIKENDSEVSPTKQIYLAC